MKTSLPLLLIFALLLAACGESSTKKILVYNGPIREVENVEYYYSENDQVTVKMKADIFYEFESGDREFPKGIHFEFFNEFGKLQSTLRANHAYFFEKENKWRGQGDVEVKNIEKREQLNTEELFWKPADETIFTDKFVTIRQQSDVIYGNGLDAKQDLSFYKILDVHGTMGFEEE